MKSLWCLTKISYLFFLFLLLQCGESKKTTINKGMTDKTMENKISPNNAPEQDLIDYLKKIATEQKDQNSSPEKNPR